MVDNFMQHMKADAIAGFGWEDIVYRHGVSERLAGEAAFGRLPIASAEDTIQ